MDDITGPGREMGPRLDGGGGKKLRVEGPQKSKVDRVDQSQDAG